jgi:hypothetical protein
LTPLPSDVAWNSGMIASYADFGVEYATRVTSPGVALKGEADAAGALEPVAAADAAAALGAADEPGGVDAQADAPGAAVVGLAAADELAALGALEDAVIEAVAVVDGLVVAAVPAHALTRIAPVTTTAAPRRARYWTGPNILPFRSCLLSSST